MTQKHQTNVAQLVNNPLFRNHTDTVPDFVLLEDDRNNRFDVICGTSGGLRSGTRP